MRSKNQKNPQSQLQKKFKRILLFGTFDIIHQGHEDLFLQAYQLAKEVFVVVARDRTVNILKKRSPIHSMNERIRALQAIPRITKVIPGSGRDKLTSLKKFHPDCIGLGYDQTHFVAGLQEYLRKNDLKIPIIRFQPYLPHIYKTTLLKQRYARRTIHSRTP